MPNHASAIVPIESWCYNSPELLFKGNNIDVGLFAESLIYYNNIYLNFSTSEQFSNLLSWLISQKSYDQFIELINEGIVKIYYYDFISSAIEKDGAYMIWNIQTEEQVKKDTFKETIMYSKVIDKIIPHSRHRIKLYKALEDKVITAKADDFGPPIENARLDYQNPERSAVLIQSFLNTIYPKIFNKKVPLIESKVKNIDNSKFETSFNIDINELSLLCGKKLNFHKGAPLTGAAHCNRLIWSAAFENCDLYLGEPMSSLIGDKLFESSLRVTKTHKIIESLNKEVEFPDIRNLINKNEISFKDVLSIRNKAQKFRSWLQQEGERDRNAIIAYHKEIAKENNLIKYGRKTLQLFGLIGGSFLGIKLHNDPFIAISASLGTKYISDIVSKINKDWKPVVFGNWLCSRIQKILNNN